jgi:diguanylate cyclase (GGDEF)-like protein
MITVLYYKHYVLIQEEALKEVCKDIANIVELPDIRKIRDDVNTYKPRIVFMEYSFTQENNGYYLRLIKEIDTDIYIVVVIPEFIGAKNLDDLLTNRPVDMLVNTASPPLEVKALIDFITAGYDKILKHRELEHKYEDMITDYSDYKNVLAGKDQDIADLKDYISQIIIEDELTKLANERYFITTSKVILEECRRYKYNSSISVLEIDNIPQIMEVYGQECVDLIIKETADVIKDSIRQNDIAGISNDHSYFMITHKKINFDAVRNVADRIRNQLNDHIFNYQSKQLRITVSIGVASSINYFRNTYSYEELLSMARIALQNSIQKGRNQIIAYS